MSSSIRDLVSVAAVLLLAVAAVAWHAPAASASHDVTPARVDGATRADTAANVAQTAYPDGAEVAFVARDDGFADALASSALAGHEQAPILLTDTDELTDRTADALEDLGVQHVTILGGPAAVSQSVEDELDESYDVGRVEGPTRYHTARDLTVAVQSNNDNQANFPGGQRAFFVANGQRFPDALTAGAPAAGEEIPTLLVEQDAIPQPTSEAVEQLDMELAIIVGGADAVSQQVQDEFEDMGVATDRVAGATRNSTATRLADFAREHLGFTSTRPLLARGDHFPDALAAGPLGGVQQVPIVLTATPHELSGPTADWLIEQCSNVDAVRAIGGRAAVSSDVLETAERAAEECHGSEGDTSQTYIVAPQEAVEADPGYEQDYSVSGRYDDQPFEGPIDIVLFPCEQVDDVEGSGDPSFQDTNDDGRADGIESTDTDAAVITYATGTDDPGQKGKRDASPGEDGTVDFGVAADAPDCAVPTVFQDTNDDSALNVDVDGAPTEPYGVGKISWN